MNGNNYKVISLPHLGAIRVRSKDEQSWENQYESVILPNARKNIHEIFETKIV